jgi:hypothetical protein
MPRLDGVRSIPVPGWTAGLREELEPGTWNPRDGGVLDDGANLVPINAARLAVRGGTRVALTFTQLGVARVVGVFPFTPTGAVAIAYSPTEMRHYAYALTDTLGWALPPGAPTEAGSRCVLGGEVSGEWETETEARPEARELFETLYVVDAGRESARRGLAAVRVQAGSLVSTTPAVDFLPDATNPTPLKAAAVAAFNSHLFVAGFDSEGAPSAPHMLRHSFLGRDPAGAGGFDADAYAIIGAQGQAIRALAPGSSLLLVAKENELYRVTGAGRGLPGWQFAVQQLDNTLGLGCSNPRALAHVGGWWYGVGQGGPFRTDGARVESLVADRRRSWKRAAALETAVVAHHPDRRLVLFGFYESVDAAGRIEAPFRWWAWDLERETWQPSWVSPKGFVALAAIPRTRTGAAEPPPPPGGPVQVLADEAFEETAITLTFQSADVSAATEVWMRPFPGYAGGDTLVATLPPGVQRARLAVPRPGFPVTVDYDPQLVKLRHARTANGVTLRSGFSGETAMYPRLPRPLIVGGTDTRSLPSDPQIAARYTRTRPGAIVVVEDSSGRVREWSSATALEQGPAHLSRTTCYARQGVDFGMAIRAEQRHPDWPDALRSRPYIIQQAGLACVRPVDAVAPEVRQVIGGAGDPVDALVLNVTPAWQFFPSPTLQYQVDYRVEGTLPWIGGVTFSHSPLDTSLGNGFTVTQTVTIAPIAPATAYEVRVRNLTSGEVSAPVRVCTPIPAPTVAAQTVPAPTAGGTSTLRLTCGLARAGLGLEVLNSTGAFTYRQVAPAASAVVERTGAPPEVGDRYFVRAYEPSWPEGLRFSRPTELPHTPT